MVKQMVSKGQVVFRPVVVLTGLCLLTVLILIASETVTPPSLIARELGETAATPPAPVKTAAADATDTAASDQTAQAPDVTALASKIGPADLHILGSADAPVTIIEYSSMTCPHCAHYHETTFPELKKRYIDTGKVRYVLREFPLDDLAAAAFMLARCAPSDKYFDFVDMLYAKQADWAGRGKKPIDELEKLSKQAGITKKRFDECISDQATLDQIVKIRADAHQQLGVNSTPTFFVNGEQLKGDNSIDGFAKVIEPLLKKAKAAQKTPAK